MSTEDPRFAGIARLYGIEGLERLRAAHVAIVGVGGVGSWAAEAMARCGVGEISLFDLDDVCVSNANRQLHALDSTVGKPKVEVMAERLRGINPDCTVHAVPDFVTRETMAEYITPNIDCVIDCIDAVNAKAALIAWCKRRKIQIITTGGAGGQIDREAPDGVGEILKRELVGQQTVGARLDGDLNASTALHLGAADARYFEQILLHAPGDLAQIMGTNLAGNRHIQDGEIVAGLRNENPGPFGLVGKRRDRVNPCLHIVH